MTGRTASDTARRRSQALAMYRRDTPVRQIARELGVTPRAVRRYLEGEDKAATQTGTSAPHKSPSPKRPCTHPRDLPRWAAAVDGLQPDRETRCLALALIRWFGNDPSEERLARSAGLGQSAARSRLRILADAGLIYLARPGSYADARPNSWRLQIPAALVPSFPAPAEGGTVVPLRRNA